MIQENPDTSASRQRGSMVLIFLNPRAGTAATEAIRRGIDKALKGRTPYEIITLGSLPGSISDEIRKRIPEGTPGTVVAAGGDGTVNSVASALRARKEITMGIIPTGSGNGLARELKIPVNVGKALDLILTGTFTEVDCCYINGIPFFCTAGTGLDAHVGKLFMETRRRGFFAYLKITVREFLAYRPQSYSLDIDGKKFRVTASVITFANASQYGFNAVVSPAARLNDGKIEVTVIRPYGFFSAAALTFRLFRGTIHRSKLVDTYSGENIRLMRDHDDVIHFDGESVVAGKELHVRIEPKAVKIISRYQ